ncbi:MAG: tRNA (adenosine(37)-N6)-threonylcarbamoyltransferase complex dimerization subunit type 1 TsaB [Holosporaceae bacterium]|jgi:tRNA threonylcarbamoyl adenosine modification protein YeaZ|nr:tRNA (adenosine(37)-N6)-threonylcarbamoyltransferase complex dimerization subunit type 1 TsaB [Holosporaceae bacterium]
MNVLAVSACLKRCSAAIICDGTVCERDFQGDSSGNLANVVDGLLRENSIEPKKIDGIIVASGPGSFTGIRVASSLGHGMALALKIPILGINYFSIIDEMYREDETRQYDPDRLILIETEKKHLYFKHGSREPGVSSYENIFAYIDENKIETIVGDAQISHRNIVFINDFRKARRLLAFSKELSAKSTAVPLYLNAAAAINEN